MCYDFNQAIGLAPLFLGLRDQGRLARPDRNGGWMRRRTPRRLTAAWRAFALVFGGILGI
jgi:hypothetical protein